MALGSMTDDELLSRGTRRLPHPLALSWFMLLALVLGGVLFTALFGRGAGSGPVVRLSLGAAGTRHAVSIQTTGKKAAKAVPKTPAETRKAVPVPKAAPAPTRIDKPIYAGKALLADPALVEATAEGPLPRIGADGRTPMQAYAPAVPAAALKGRKPISLLITGLGVGAKATEAAIKELPPAVTLAFAPFSADLQRWIAAARQAGHEVLLEVPMEPFDYPDSDPGPHTLRPMLGEDANIERLKWALTRATGYAGITNLQGGRFLSSAGATAPIMSYLARRGLMFYDSGTAAVSSAASNAASQASAAYVGSDLNIDRVATAPAIDQRLSLLESQARSNGSAAGTGFLYPLTLDRVVAWAKGLKGRGFVLVPASAIVGRDK